MNISMKNLEELLTNKDVISNLIRQIEVAKIKEEDLTHELDENKRLIADLQAQLDEICKNLGVTIDFTKDDTLTFETETSVVPDIASTVQDVPPKIVADEPQVTTPEVVEPELQTESLRFKVVKELPAIIDKKSKTLMELIELLKMHMVVLGRVATVDDVKFICDLIVTMLYIMKAPEELIAKFNSLPFDVAKKYSEENGLANPEIMESYNNFINDINKNINDVDLWLRNGDRNNNVDDKLSNESEVSSEPIVPMNNPFADAVTSSLDNPDLNFESTQEEFGGR